MPPSGGDAPTRPACATSRSSRKRARSAPSLRSTESSDSNQSRVSSASMSVVALPFASVEAMLTLSPVVPYPRVPSGTPDQYMVSAAERGADVLQRSGAVPWRSRQQLPLLVPFGNDDGGSTRMTV